MHKHFSDAELLGFLDGEVSHLRRWLVQLRLFRCWECRGRKDELEAQAHRFARALRNDVFPGPGRVADARTRFEIWRREADVPVTQAAFQRSWIWGATGALGLVALAAIIFVSPQSPIVSLPHAKAPQPPPFATQVSSARVNQSVPATVVTKAPSGTQVRAAVKKAPPGLDLVEADVHYRLHRIGACAGEPILIARNGSNSAVVVTAIGPPERRKQEIEESLRDLAQKGLVRFELSGTRSSPVSPEALGSAGETLRTQSVNSPLAEKFGSAAEFARRSNIILHLGEAIYAQAWAVQRHASLPEPDQSKRSPAHWLAEAMHRDHTERIQRDLEKLDAELAPVLGEQSGACTQSSPMLFEAARDLTALLNRLFAPSLTTDTSAPAAEELASALQRMKCSVR